MSERINNVVNFPGPNYYEINGLPLDLENMERQQLELLESQCNERYMEAHTDLTIVRDTIARRFLVDGGAA